MRSLSKIRFPTSVPTGCSSTTLYVSVIGSAASTIKLAVNATLSISSSILPQHSTNIMDNLHVTVSCFLCLNGLRRLRAVEQAISHPAKRRQNPLCAARFSMEQLSHCYQLRPSDHASTVWWRQRPAAGETLIGWTCTGNGLSRSSLAVLSRKLSLRATTSIARHAVAVCRTPPAMHCERQVNHCCSQVRCINSTIVNSSSECLINYHLKRRLYSLLLW